MRCGTVQCGGWSPGQDVRHQLWLHLLLSLRQHLNQASVRGLWMQHCQAAAHRQESSSSRLGDVQPEHDIPEQDEQEEELPSRASRSIREDHEETDEGGGGPVQQRGHVGEEETR